MMNAAERTYYMRLGLNFRVEIMGSSLNQKKLAHGMRMAESSLCRMLCGQQPMTVRQFVRLVRFVGTSVGTVLTPEVHSLAEQARLVRSMPMTVEEREVA